MKKLLTILFILMVSLESMHAQIVDFYNKLDDVSPTLSKSNLTADSNLNLDDQVTLYFIDIADWNIVYAYVWSDSGEYVSWPGEKTQWTGEKVNGKNIYSYTFPVQYSNIIFSGGCQTQDLVWNLSTPYCTIDTTTMCENWQGHTCCGIWLADIPPSKCGDNLYWDFNPENGMISITGYGDMYNYEITETPWNTYCKQIYALSLPEGMTSIGVNAFYGCSNLSSVTIPNSVTSIGEGAFHYCSNLTKVTIGDSVSSIGVGAFANCITLDTIYNNAEIPQVIGSSVFRGVDKPNCRLIVPPGSLALYKAADVWKEFLIEEEEVLCIADYGMCGEYVGWTVNCDSTELWIEGSGVMSDGAPWAEYYGSIRKIILDKGITRIGAGAFAGASIAKITIPGKVNSLGAGAFSGCSSLSSIVCEAVTPPVCDANVFAGVNKSIPLVIPERSREAYKAADQWRDFFPAGDSQEITGPDTIPTVDEVTQLYPLTGNNLVVCLYFDVAPCNDVYFPGNYRMNASGGGWSTDISELERFEPLPGFPGWYVVEVPYMNNAQGKPVQLRSDDIFDWEYQSGDANAWINHGTLEATVVSGYPGEADIYYPVPGCYIYELVYWKNHKSPCTVVPKHDYTIQLYAPDACEEMKPAIVGTFNNWSIFDPMTETTDLQGRKVYAYTIYGEEGHFFKFVEPEEGWSNQLQYYDLEYGYWQNFDNYILPETDQDTTLVFDYSDNGKYRFASCENNVPTIPSGINNAISEKDEPRKLFRDGQLLIQNGEKVYTLQGVEVK